MRMIKVGVVVASACLGLACLLAANASADDLRRDKAHPAGEYGAGGWAPNYGAKPSARGAIAVVNKEVAVNRPDPRDAADFDRRLRLFDDSDCLYPPERSEFRRRWPFTCK
ncbi:MAG: hypothetical protein JO107_08785 [Hyphomicrobiales bacterium]|nr:hypothetical protein [Hyphomicrobiales bacterium]MBV8663185.1 hypothetical protein [Hyphomicrobiales bacterium]